MQSVYLDLKQRPVKAWRMSGVAARLCLELGLHREKFFEDAKALPQRIIDWKRLFACVYRIDRKCSFYSGLPWTLHDRDLDASVLRIVWLSISTFPVATFLQLTSLGSGTTRILSVNHDLLGQ
jgi:hypothetical protein